MKPIQFVVALRTYLIKFKKGLEMLNRNRTRLNEDQKSNGMYLSELGGSFESIFALETESPVQSDTFAASLSRQHVDLQKLTQWNIEVKEYPFGILSILLMMRQLKISKSLRVPQHITLRDESFSDGLNDYTILVTDFLKFVRAFEEEEVRPFERWRNGYLTSRLNVVRKSLEGQAEKEDLRDKLAESLAKDDLYNQISKNFFHNFDHFITESEV